MDFCCSSVHEAPRAEQLVASQELYRPKYRSAIIYGRMSRARRPKPYVCEFPGGLRRDCPMAEVVELARRV